MLSVKIVGRRENEQILNEMCSRKHYNREIQTA